jgi:hypothetical protein
VGDVDPDCRLRIDGAGTRLIFDRSFNCNQTEEVVMTANDNEQAIRNRAYELWEADGRPDGKQESHWHQAVMELGLANPLEQAVGTTVDPKANGRLRRPAASTTGLP